jgi:hypothetical protein
MHEIHVTVVSPEEAAYGTAELWSGGRLIGSTRLEDGDLMLRIEPGHDGAAVVVGAQPRRRDRGSQPAARALLTHQPKGKT